MVIQAYWGRRKPSLAVRVALACRPSSSSRTRFDCFVGGLLRLRPRADMLPHELRQPRNRKIALLLTDVRQQLGEWHGGLIVLLNRGAQYHSVQRLHAQPAKQQRFRTHGVGIIPILAEVLHGFQNVGENLRLCGLHFRLPNAWTCTRGVPAGRAISLQGPSPIATTESDCGPASISRSAAWAPPSSGTI